MRHLLLACLALLLAGPSPTRIQDGTWPLTRAEASGYQETSRYDDVVAFLDEVVPRSPLLSLTRMGYTMEGREIPLVVAGREIAPTPESVLASGKLRVYVQGNIHGGEVCGKEALQMLLREIARGDHDDWFDQVVLLIAPIYNADGNERVLLTNRPGQNGPFGGMGQRPNAQGLDLNRDHMKLESPEARSLVGMMRDFDPHVAVDLHTTNGTRHAYHLTYSPPLHPNTPAGIDALLRDAWLPAMTASIRAEHGWEFYYYGNLPYRDDVERGWYTFDHRPRFNNNYVGLRNRVAILSEAYAYATFEDRVLASLYFVQHIVDFAAANAAQIAEAVARAETEDIRGAELALRATFARSAEPVEILLGDVKASTHPLTGRRVGERLDVVTPEAMHEYGAFAATVSERVPDAYLVPADLTAVVDLLRSHGVRLEPLDVDGPLEVERFRITGTEVAAREFQGHRERIVEGTYERSTVDWSGGMLRVPMDQPLARLVFTLLEPRSDDGVANWNLVDGAIEDATFYPIARIPAAGGQ